MLWHPAPGSKGKHCFVALFLLLDSWIFSLLQPPECEDSTGKRRVRAERDLLSTPCVMDGKDTIPLVKQINDGEEKAELWHTETWSVGMSWVGLGHLRGLFQP